MTSKHWTREAKEKAFSLQGLVPYREIARRLGRTEKAVQMLMRRYGRDKWVQRQYQQRPWEKRFRELHARGMSDCQIARKMDVSQPCVNRWRKLLGLPINKMPPGYFKTGHRKALQTMGVQSLSEIRWDREKDKKPRYYWEKPHDPACLV